MVVHGVDGLDEISTVGKTVIAHLKDGNVTKAEMSPSDFGLKKARHNRFAVLIRSGKCPNNPQNPKR